MVGPFVAISKRHARLSTDPPIVADDAVRILVSEHDTVVWPSLEASFTFH
jgi:hypothetical protein